jgi:hypothetical protein
MTLPPEGASQASLTSPALAARLEDKTIHQAAASFRNTLVFRLFLIRVLLTLAILAFGAARQDFPGKIKSQSREKRKMAQLKLRLFLVITS